MRQIKIRIEFPIPRNYVHFYHIPDARHTFCFNRGRDEKNFASTLNTEDSTSLEYAPRPAAIPINSGFSFPKKEATSPPFIGSGFSI